ncbi:hypothetical protein CASFOL_017643 [Castilleja foliolosa]|uniref:Peptide transporter n=1 Tax=Castilleja foliolosa TaxID=1961234 RepID=A0ABD3D9A3_9LAMI
MHEATLRFLSMLLQQIDGFEQEKKVVVVLLNSYGKNEHFLNIRIIVTHKKTLLMICQPTSTITATGIDMSEVEAPLLYDVAESSVDFKGCPAVRSKSGCWKSASFVIAVEMAANVNAWSGTAFLSPLVGAFIADSYLGKYRTVIIASLLYILGLGFLSLSAALHFDKARSLPQPQIIFYFCSLYLVALAQGGHKSCLKAFGAEQFDESDEDECKAKSSFFNWWNFCLCASALVLW